MLRSLLTAKAMGPGGTPVPDFAITSTPGRRLAGVSQRRHLQAYGGEDAIDHVMNCVDLYAQTASNAKYYFTKPLSPGAAGTSIKPEPLKRAPADLVNLFREPNPYMDYTELLELSIIDLLAAGEFFWLKYKPGLDPTSPEFAKPLSLYRLSPALVEIVLDKHDRPDYIEYRAPGQGEPVRFRPEDVVHVKRPNPHDPWRGLSIISGGPRVYDLELALVEAMANYYENGTRPSGVLESDRTVPFNTWNKIKRQFQQMYAGKSNSGLVVMLEKGLKFNAVAANASDGAFKDISTLSVERIARAFKVPLPLLGAVGSADRQAVKESQRIFDNKVMRPFLNRIQEQVTRQLVAAWGLELYIDYEYVMPIEDKIDLAEAKASIPGILVEEARAQMDLAPLATIDGVENGAEIDKMVLNMPGEDREQGGFPDRSLGSEAGRPPNGENTRTFPKDGSVPAGAAVKKSMDAAESAADLRRAIRSARKRLRDMA